MRLLRRKPRFRPTVPVYDPAYAGQMASYAGQDRPNPSPGLHSEDHVTGDWWHSSLISHLNYNHTRLHDDDRTWIQNGYKAGEPFMHSLACPLGMAQEEHVECHDAGQDHA